MSKIFDGDFKQIPQFVKQMDAYLKDQNKKAKNYYIHYAYSPKCAAREGHNYMVFFCKVRAVNEWSQVRGSTIG